MKKLLQIAAVSMCFLSVAVLGTACNRNADEALDDLIPVSTQEDIVPQEDSVLELDYQDIDGQYDSGYYMLDYDDNEAYVEDEDIEPVEYVNLGEEEISYPEPDNEEDENDIAESEADAEAYTDVVQSLDGLFAAQGAEGIYLSFQGNNVVLSASFGELEYYFGVDIPGELSIAGTFTVDGQNISIDVSDTAMRTLTDEIWDMFMTYALDALLDGDFADLLVLDIPDLGVPAMDIPGFDLGGFGFGGFDFGGFDLGAFLQDDAMRELMVQVVIDMVRPMFDVLAEELVQEFAEIDLRIGDNWDRIYEDVEGIVFVRV